MKPKYFHVSLGYRVRLPIGERSNRGGIEDSMQSVKMEYFSFHMFDDKTKTVKKFGQYIITTKEMRIRNVNWFVLCDNETIIHKWKDRN